MPSAVVVTGIGVISPLNPDGDRERFWTSLCAGETAVRRIRSFDVSPYPCHVAAEVGREWFDGDGRPEEPALRMAEVAFERSLDHAGIPAGVGEPRRAGIVVGSVLGGTLTGERYLRAREAHLGQAAATGGDLVDRM
ncbi:MAG: beta-ketoacyl synthase N-terminal-like domain-containing protein, partial [candidate division NC10 bacterium]